jgi:DNA-binding NarL/FixJ family response regulator
MLKRILVVDDSATFRDAIRSSLENQTGFEVCGEAVDGADAVEKARELKPDLILLDLVMPGMNGVEITSLLKGMMPEVPIILLTAHDDNVGKALAPVAGASSILDKQARMSKLIECTQGLLERSDHRA